MLGLTIILDGEGSLRGKEVEEAHGELIVLALEGGMASGNPSVGIAVERPDGSFLLAQTSMKLFLTAADAFRARFGDPRHEAKGAPV